MSAIQGERRVTRYLLVALVENKGTPPGAAAGPSSGEILFLGIAGPMGLSIDRVSQVSIY